MSNLTIINNNPFVYRYAQAYYNLHSDLFNAQIIQGLTRCSIALNKEKPYLHILNTTLKQYISAKIEITYSFVQNYGVTLPLTSLFTLLLTNEHFNLLPDIFLRCIQLYEETNGIMRFNISSAQPLSEQQKATCIQFLQHKTKHQIDAEFNLNQDLIAGIKAQSSTYLYENSIRKKIETIKRLIS